MDKEELKALIEKMKLEAYECGMFGYCKNKYKVSYCKKTREHVVQVWHDNNWLCLHD